MIQWYPGHMHKAQKEMKAAMSQIDLVIEVLDARIPFSSANPVISELREKRPCIKVLTRHDLSDPKTTESWLKFFREEEHVEAVALSLLQMQAPVLRKLTRLARQLFPERTQLKQEIRAMVMGIPNVGKSTLINRLAGSAKTKVGGEPAVTRRQQRIDLKNGIILNDTPGILWPKIEDKQSSYLLAMTGAIKSTAMDADEVADVALSRLLVSYPEALLKRYKLKVLPEDAEQALVEIGKRRGCLKIGGVVDLNKAAEVLLFDLRIGALGRMSLEEPTLATD